MRIEKDVKSFSAEFNYSDEMGITISQPVPRHVEINENLAKSIIKKLSNT
jgi:hypothetical protein